MRIHSHLTDNHSEDMCNAPHCIPHQDFAQTVVEQVRVVTVALDALVLCHDV